MPSFVLIFSVATRNCMGTVYIKSIKSGSEIIKGLSVYPTSNKQYLWEEKRFFKSVFLDSKYFAQRFNRPVNKDFWPVFGHPRSYFCKILQKSFCLIFLELEGIRFRVFCIKDISFQVCPEMVLKRQTKMSNKCFCLISLDKEKNDVWVHMKMPQGIEFLYFAALSPAKTKFLTDEEFTVSWFCNSNTSF